MKKPTKQDLEDYNISEKTVERFVFTPEQLNEYTANVIKDTLDNAAEKAKVKEEIANFAEGSYLMSSVNRESITNTFEETFNKFKA